MKTFSKKTWFIAWAALIALALVVFTGILWYIKTRPVVNEYIVRLKDEKGQIVNFEYGSLPSLTDPDYYQNVKGQLTSTNADFISADLATRKLEVYKKGILVKEVPIAAIGKPGSWSETPSGLYRIQDKQKSHRSSFEPVTMSWNLPFQGNFFIHGWPRNVSNGQPVSSSDSAGCIRLSDADAKAVYDLAQVGMPVLVHAGAAATDTFSYGVNIPTISGKTYLAADLSNNFVFLEHNQNFSYPLAGFAKLVDAFVVSEYMATDRAIKVTADMLATTSKPRLIVGRIYTPYDLIFPLILEDSNEAAQALGAVLGRARFIELMNTKVQSLGMDGTAIVDLGGGSNANVTTARDLFQLAKAMMQYRSFLFTITRDPKSAMTEGAIKFTDIVSANNPFSNDAGYVGGIVTRGEKETGLQSVLAVFSLDFKGIKRSIAIISLNTTSPTDDVRAMLNYIKRVYQ